jgi:hypothetical protein
VRHEAPACLECGHRPSDFILLGATALGQATSRRLDVAIEVRTESLDTGMLWFPTMSFRSVAVQVDSLTILRVTGDLAIRGVTHRITIPVVVLGTSTVEGVGETTGFESRFTIDRTSFGVNGTRWSGGRMSLSRDVDIELHIAAQAQSIAR